MERIIDQIIENNPDKIILLDWLLLPKTKFFDKSDLKLWIEAPFIDRLDRAVKRSINEQPITPEYFEKRDNAGIDYEEGEYDIVINNINKEKTQEEVKKIYEKSILRR